MEQPSSKTLAAWDDVRGLSDFANQIPVAAQGGYFNQVLVLPKHILRVPRAGLQARRTLEYEVELYMQLGKNAQRSPLTIPEITEARYVPDASYAMLTRLSGTVLSDAEVRHLSEDEKVALGNAMGAFVVWYADAVPLPVCRQFIHQTGTALPDCLNDIRPCARLAVTAGDIDSGLKDVLLTSWRQLKHYRANGMLTPTITGHNDLRPGNLTFTEENGIWQPYGVFDFGVTQPSMPERELRYAACLGRSVCQAAIETYELQTGTTLSEPLIDFWGITQASTMLAWNLIDGSKEGLAFGRSSMQVLRPDYDWSRSFIKDPY